jgi:3-phenylpropionate/cinnamic acid dioxygenase small subunit
MTNTPQPVITDAPAGYEEIQQFYAHHMHALDAGDAAAWAETLTEDVVFAQNIRPEPRRGREVVVGRMKLGAADLAERGVTRRHWLGMLDVRQRDDRTVDTRCYVLVVETAEGGRAGIRASTVCADVLVRDGGRWLLKSREINHDGVS